MRFAELMESQLEPGLNSVVRELLELKRSAPERKIIPQIHALNEYPERSMTEIKLQIAGLPEKEPRGWSVLNALFRSAWEE